MKKYSYFILIIIGCFAGCKSFFEQTRENIVRTGDVTAFVNTAQAEGLLFDVGDDVKKKIIAYGHVWSLEDEPTIENATAFKTDFGTRDTFGDYESILANLSPETTYYVRAYIRNDEGVSYGKTIKFISGLVSVNAVFNISKNSAKVKGIRSTTVTAESIGFCYSTESNPTITNSIANAVSNTTTSAVFEANLQGLNAGTQYFIRPFMRYDGGKVTYGEEFIFSTFED